MSRNLNPEEKEKLRDKYGEHIFFRLVNQSCKRYERGMRVFRFSPEDVFVEALNVLDDLKAPNRNNDDLCDTLWDDLFCDFRERGENIPDEELDKAVAIVLSVVTYCLVLLDSMRYNGWVGKLNKAMQEHYPNYLTIQISIDMSANKIEMDAIKDWLVEYMQTDNYLSEEVEDNLEDESGDDKIGMKSNVFLNPKKGYKIDFIRAMNSLYELGHFQDAQGGSITKKEFFTTLGRFVNVDLKDYDKDLSRALGDSTALDKNLKIFVQMKEKMEEIFNSK